MLLTILIVKKHELFILEAMKNGISTIQIAKTLNRFLLGRGR